MTNFEIGDKVRIAAHSQNVTFDTGLAGCVGEIEKVSEINAGPEIQQLCNVRTPSGEGAFWGYELAGVK